MKQEISTYYLEPGYIFISGEPYLVHTVLGSCISVCLWDSDAGVGGMNHFVIARLNKKQSTARYGEVSIPYMVRQMLELGCHAHAMRAHIVGGAQNAVIHSVVGAENIELAERLMDSYKIEVVTKDVGGSSGRKVVFNSSTGEIIVYKGINVRRTDWY